MGYKDGTIRVWDIVKGTCETVLTGHKGAITALAYNKGGALLASGSTDTDIIVWDAVAEAGLFRLKGHRDQVTTLTFHTLWFMKGIYIYRVKKLKYHKRRTSPGRNCILHSL